MPNISSKVRAVAGVVVVISLAAMYLLWTRFLSPTPTVEETAIQAPADGSLAVTVDGFGYASFDVIAIRGAGFDPDAATAVVFTTRTKQRLTVPASQVTATEVKVPVPPLEYDEAKGAFAPDQVSLMVIQTKRNGDRLSVRTSNQSKLFMVAAPTMPSAVVKAGSGAMPKGSIAQVAIAVAVEKLKSAASKVPEGNPEMTAALAKAQKGMEEVLTGIEKIKKNPKATVRLATTDGSTVIMGVDDVAKIDLIYGGYLGMLEKRMAGRPGENPTGLIAPAQAASPDECYQRVMANPNADPRLGSLVEIMCGTSGTLGQAGDPGWVNEPYLIQAILSFQLSGLGDKLEWNIPLKVASAAALSMYFDSAIDGKLPDAGFLNGLLTALGMEYGDKVLEHLYGKRIPFLANLQAAIEIWDLGCMAFKWTGCLSSKEIAVGVGDIIMDIGDRINDRLLTYVDAILPPDYSKALDLGPGGIRKGGYDEWIGPDLTKEPYLPEQVTTPSKQSPPPVVPDDITPELTPSSPGTKRPPPPPPPPPPSCYKMKEDALKQCQADCPEEQPIEEYQRCTAGCDSIGNLLTKSGCINDCIGTRSRAASARSQCFSACMKAYYNTVCP